MENFKHYRYAAEYPDRLRINNMEDYDIDRILAESRHKEDLEKLKKLIKNLREKGVIVS